MSFSAPLKKFSPLEDFLLQALQESHFEEVVDFGPGEDKCPGAFFCPQVAPRIKHPPNLDLAVIQFGRNGKVKDAANVLLSRDYPQGLVVPLDQNFGTEAVRFQGWDIERWNGGTFSPETGQPLSVKGWQDEPPVDIVAGRENAPYQFMSPYPASNFKLLIAYWLMRLLDQGQISLDQLHTFQPSPDDRETRPVRDWLDPMITFSSNRATEALLALLWELDQVEAMNRGFRELGLGTLQINDTQPVTGRPWRPGRFHMTGLDTARLLWLIDGASEGTLWQRPDGKAVDNSELSDSSRAYLKNLLAEQGLNEALSTANLTGAPRVRPGIPALVAERWLNPLDGTVTVDGTCYGQDIREANAQAEVVFAHKTGLTYNYGSDAGVVRSRPGKIFRHYIIVFFSNLGYRYADPIFASRKHLPTQDKVGPIFYSQRIPNLGKQIDDWIKATNNADTQ